MSSANTRLIWIRFVRILIRFCSNLKVRKLVGCPIPGFADWLVIKSTRLFAIKINIIVFY
jgi:hypothetical protein